MSGSRWVSTSSCLSGSWISFFYGSSVYSCHLFLISSASVRSRPFLSFIEPIFAWNIPLVSLIFLKRSLVFPNLLFSSISLHWSLRKAFLSLLAILWNSAFRCLYLSFSHLLFTSLLFTAICKASSDSHFAFLQTPWTVWKGKMIGYWKRNSPGQYVPNMLLESSGEITPERMKGWSQSKNNTKLWMWLVIGARSDSVRAIFHWNLECQVHESRQIGSGQRRDGKSERRHSRNQQTKMDWNEWI